MPYIDEFFLFAKNKSFFPWFDLKAYDIIVAYRKRYPLIRNIELERCEPPFTLHIMSYQLPYHSLMNEMILLLLLFLSKNDITVCKTTWCRARRVRLYNLHRTLPTARWLRRARICEYHHKTYKRVHTCEHFTWNMHIKCAYEHNPVSYSGKHQS